MHLAPAILVFEKRPRWEATLKRGLSPETVLVRPCRSPGDLLALCRLMPGSVIVIDLDAGIKPVLQCLEQALMSRLNVLPLVVEAGDMREMEWMFRELGALAVLPEFVRADELTKLCRRLLAG